MKPADRGPLWLASGNPKKRAELDRLLRPLGFGLHLQSEAPGAGEVVEDRPDFAGNAEKKALALANLVGAPALGDDSGLCVDALFGRPGVLSARYAGPGATDRQRIEKLLGELEAVPAAERTARFVCSLCLVDGTGRIRARFEDSCKGLILAAPRGTAGFGYDPIFQADPHRRSDVSFAELSPDEKDAVSHRGKALRRLATWLENNDL